MCDFRNEGEVARISDLARETSEFLRIRLRLCSGKNSISLARVFANNFSTRASMRLKIFFSSRRRPQPQRKPEVRAIVWRIIDNLFKQLAETPLTPVLAGVKSATRLKLSRCETYDFGRDMSGIQHKIAVRLGSSLQPEAT